jgi:hypothetical protein
MRYGILLVCFGFLLTGCTDSPTGPTVPLDQAFVLAPGEAATIEEESINVLFDRVSGDSRCPSDVVCIQGGDAIVNIEVTGPGFDRTAYELHTGSTDPVRHGDLTIALVALFPYPFGSGTIPGEDYRATLRVTR